MPIGEEGFGWPWTMVMVMMGSYPSTINEELIELSQLCVNIVDNMGDDTAVLFGWSGVASVDHDEAAASAPTAAMARSHSDAASLASSTIGKHRSPIWAHFDEVKETIDGEQKVISI